MKVLISVYYSHSSANLHCCFIHFDFINVVGGFRNRHPLLLKITANLIKFLTEVGRINYPDCFHFHFPNYYFASYLGRIVDASALRLHYLSNLHF